jgi:hypothetical protein
LTQPAGDRLQDSLRAILAALLPTLAYYGVWEYRVLGSVPPVLAPPVPLPLGTPITVDCVALDAAVAATLPPTLSAKVLQPGPSGLVAIPKVGSVVLVGFANGSPGKPYIHSLDPSQAPGYTPFTPFAQALSVAATTPQVAAAGLLLLQELEGI